MTPRQFAAECRACNPFTDPETAAVYLKAAADSYEGVIEQAKAACEQKYRSTLDQYAEQVERLKGRISDLEDELEDKRIELAQLGGLDALIGRLKCTTERSEAVTDRLEAVQVKVDKPAAKKQSTKSKTQKEPSKKYGEYKHVKLTDTQYKNLVSKYGTKIIDEYIRKVDEYCQRDGKTYNDYSLAIQNFMRRDNIQPEANAGNEHSYDLNKLLKHAQDNVPTIKEG